MAERQNVPFCALPPRPEEAICGQPGGGLETFPVTCGSTRVSQKRRSRSGPGCATSVGGVRLSPAVRARPRRSMGLCLGSETGLPLGAP
ncbi:hypothetical protein NDU88_003706 [Pleurodeles waltl]|uniref:Uncharacterized protein n=1 Tax=Pleurodeles waltl TaxID=8319 RepID=A0AAV7MRD6_PLEWA|nr:hypothetical protein NDU88_003706 [Pleurodeles waltl]